VVLAVVALALNVFGSNDQPRAGSVGNTSSAPVDSLPPDERCTPEIMSNERWVCLTSAIIADGKITIDYRSDGKKFDVHGIHLHIWGSDGENPPARIMGFQVPKSERGTWYNEGHKPAVLPVTDERFVNSIGDAKKVCARIGDAQHMLVPDENGTYVTGNCVPITRTDSTTTETTEEPDPDGNNNPPPPDNGGTTEPSTTEPTTTEPTTTEPTTEANASAPGA
jgi:molecular chaperone DnaK